MLPETFAAWYLRDGEFFTKAAPVLSAMNIPNLFDEDRTVAFVIGEATAHFVKYGHRPTIDIIRDEASSRENLDYRDVWRFLDAVEAVEIEDKGRQWALDKAEAWIKKLSVINAIEDAHVKLMENTGNYETILPAVEKAVSVAFRRDGGHSIMKGWRERLDEYMAEDKRIPFWLPWLNKKTYGGFRVKSLNVVMTRSGGGKTQAMVNQAVAAVFAGMNVLYITMEDGEIEIAARFDAVATGIPLTNMNRSALNPEDFKSRMGRLVAKEGYGDMVVKYFPGGVTSILDIKTFLRDIEAEQDFRPDIIFVDYLGLMKSITVAESSSTYERLGGVAVELRSLAFELGVPVWTAAQINRGGAKSDDPENEDIGESMRIIHTADFIMAIIASSEQRQAKQAVIKITKSRYGGEAQTTVVESDSDRGIICPVGEGPGAFATNQPKAFSAVLDKPAPEPVVSSPDVEAAVAVEAAKASPAPKITLVDDATILRGVLK